MAKDFSYYFAQLRKTENHRAKEAEKEIRKLYKDLLRDTQQFIAEEYVKFAQDGKLTYEILRANTENARFLEEVERRLNGISPEVSSAITRTVEDMYTVAYDGMVKAVQKSSTTEELRAALQGLQGVTAETIKAAIENPVAGLTLSDTLEKNRKNIIWDIKRQIGVGLTMGDRYDTMARRIAKSLDGDYKKAVRIVRTETGRVREAGHLESAREINDTLKQGVTNMRMVKTWKTMKDGSVRDTHSAMDGVTVPMDDDFTLPSGVKTPAPKQSGVAAEDINCRCFVKYSLEEFPETGKETPKEGKMERLTEEESAAVQSYYSSESYKLNVKLRDGEPLTHDEEEMVRRLDSALDKKPVYKGNVLRSLQFLNDEDIRAFEESHKVGGTVVYKAYTSASRKGVYNPSGQVQLLISSKSGRRMDDQKGENEVIFPRNSKFKVLEKTKKDNVIYYLLTEK